MLLFSQAAAPDPGSTAPYPSAPSFASVQTSVPGFSPGLARTAHDAEPGSDDPDHGAVRPGVTKRIRLCRCSWLYQRIKSMTQARAASRLAKPSAGHCGQYFNVRNSDSEYGLSLLTRGRPRDGVMPSSCILLNSVSDFIGAPLSECSTSGSCKHCSPIALRCSSAAAFSPLSSS